MDFNYCTRGLSNREIQVLFWKDCVLAVFLQSAAGFLIVL